MSGNDIGAELAAIHRAVLALSAELRTFGAELRAQGGKLDDVSGQCAILCEEVAKMRGEAAAYRDPSWATTC